MIDDDLDGKHKVRSFGVMYILASLSRYQSILHAPSDGRK